MLLKHKVFITKLMLHLGSGVPLLWLYLQIEAQRLGGDPVQYIIHFLGMGALHTLAISLAVSPMAKRFKLGWLVRVRRLIGLWSFTYVLLHVLAFVSLDLLFEWSLLLSEALSRPYIFVGAIGAVVLLMLAVTSPKLVQRRMGRYWQQLHRWVYLVAVLGPVHFWWSVKSGFLEPLIYLTAFLLLLWPRRSLVTFNNKRAAATPSTNR